MAQEFQITWEQNTGEPDAPVWAQQTALYDSEDNAMTAAQGLFIRASFPGQFGLSVQNVVLQFRDVSDWQNIPLTLPPDS